MNIEICEGAKGWYWRIKSRNGKILAFSEAYKDYRTALKTATILLTKKLKKVVRQGSRKALLQNNFS